MSETFKTSFQVIRLRGVRRFPRGFTYTGRLVQNLFWGEYLIWFRLCGLFREIGLYIERKPLRILFLGPLTKENSERFEAKKPRRNEPAL